MKTIAVMGLGNFGTALACNWLTTGNEVRGWTVEQEVYDSCLYTALATASGAPGNSTALVGTPETVAQALAAYYDVGAKTLLIRGYDPLPDAIEYGQELIPRVRELVKERDAQRAIG